ncbi:MAG: CARDB domain-containing protein [Candidatus Micrarchaeia archaeon]
MKKEFYFWAMFFIAVAAAAIYFRYYYQPAIGVSVSFSANQSSFGSVYPFSEVRLPVNVSNVGSAAFRNLSISILVNGNLSSVYLVTMPPGKEATIYYNFTPEGSGAYNISAVADLGKVYNVQNRNSAKSTIRIFVEEPEAARPYAVIPPGAANFSSAQGSAAGLMTAEYIRSAYGIGANVQSAALISRLINITSSYIRNVSVADASYQNGSEAYSLWLRGFLSPSIIGIAANASGMNATHAAIGNTNITVVKLGGKGTLCSWYSGGWLKTLSYYGNASCTDILGASYNSSYPSVSESEALLRNSYNSSYEQLSYFETSRIENTSYATVLLLNASTVAMASISNLVPSNTPKCIGIISSANNTNYCSAYVFPLNGSLGSVSLVRTTEIIGGYNASVISFANTSRIMYSIPSNIRLLSMLGLKGHSMSFTSPFSSYCSFANSSIGCSNPVLAYSNLTIGITNSMKGAAELKSASCYFQQQGRYAQLNATLQPGETANFTIPCYEGSSKLSGFPLDLYLTLSLNYTYNGSVEHAFGTAVINGLSPS